MGGENYMQFPDSFFEDEVRDGFYVPALMKRSWAAQIEVLNDIAKVCEKHHIRWFAMWGTLLGAVRHGGFIPWDDDIDICMLRDDYNRFLSVAEQELPEGYYLPLHGRGVKNAKMLMGVWNEREFPIEGERLQKFHGYFFPQGVDIVPFDYVSPDPDEQELQKALFELTWDLAASVTDENQDTDDMNAKIASLEEMLHLTLDRNLPLKEQLYSLANNIASMYTAEEAKEAVHMLRWSYGSPYKWPVESFKTLLMCPFEGIEIPIPSGYDDILKAYYGNYMERAYIGGDAHDYPFYRHFGEHLSESSVADRLLLTYHISTADIKRPVSQTLSSLEKLINHFLHLTAQIHTQLAEVISSGDSEKTRAFLELCQESAIHIGALLEKKWGRNNLQTVCLLEKYCEQIWQFYEPLTQGCALPDASVVHMHLDTLHEQIRTCSSEELRRKKEVVFLPWKASGWCILEPVWKAAQADPDCISYVIPVPYCYRNLDGSVKNIQYEGELLPEYVTITDYRSYDIQKQHPDIVFIQNPYDEYNLTTSVHPSFYAANLKQYTDKLIYVPYFTLDEIVPENQKALINMEHYVSMPGVVHADTVIVQSEQMRQTYIDFLAKSAGEDTKPIWEEKITCNSRIPFLKAK